MNTKQECIKLTSLNVNGLGNPVKRPTIIAKIKKERTQINFLQETHLSQTDHEKFKRFGFKSTFYSSHSNTRKRGVAILLPNATKSLCMEGTPSTTETLHSLFSSTLHILKNWIFFMQKEDRERIQEHQIGVSDLSDYSPIYLKIYLKSRWKDTIWRLNVGILNYKQVVEQIKAEI